MRILALGILLAAAPRNEDLLKSVTFYASFDSSVNADFGGGELILSTRYNHKTEKGAFVVEKGHPEKAFRIAEGRGISGGALEGLDVLPDNGRLFYPAKGNIAYKKGGWNGAVSMWVNLDPDTMLKGRSSDPVQITAKTAGNGGIWYDFNDATPNRNLRMAIFPSVTETRPMIKDSREPVSPLVWVDNPGFRQGEWHHLVLNWWNLDTERHDGRGALYVDGKLMGEIKDKDYPLSMDWDMEKCRIYVGIHLIGMMDEFAIFNRALTAGDIALLRSKPGVLAALKK